MVRDAITLVLEERRGRGEAIPDTGWALVEAVEIAALRSGSRSGTSPLRLPGLPGRSGGGLTSPGA